MKPRYTSTIIEKTEKAELVRFEFKGKFFYKVFFNIRRNDGTGLPGHITMCDMKEGFGDDEDAARAFFEEKKNGEEAKAEEKNEANTTKFNEKQIEALENKGFKRWTKGDKDRLYIKAWNLPNVKTIWKKNGKKCVEINGEELSYTKSSEVNYTSIYIDLADDSIHVDSSFADVLTEGVEMLLNSVSTTEETTAVKEDLTTEETTEVSNDIQKAFDVLNFGLVELDKIGTETAKKWYGYLLNESDKLRTEKDIARKNKMIEIIISQKDKVKKMIELAKSGK